MILNFELNQILCYLGLIWLIFGMRSKIRLHQQILFLIGGIILLIYHLVFIKNFSMICEQVVFSGVALWEIIKIEYEKYKQDRILREKFGDYIVNEFSKKP